MQVAVGEPITTTLVDPAGGYDRLGARIEVPVTEAIVSPWQDATLADGMWSVTLDPLLNAGDYLLYWMTPDDPPSFRAPIPVSAMLSASLSGIQTTVPDFPPLDPAAVRPTVQDVADLDRTRAINTAGDEVSNFEADTRPSDADVDRLITQAVGGVLGQLYPSFPTDYYEDTKHLVCLYTAILIEGSFFREQMGTEGAMFNWRLMLQNGIAALNRSIEYDLTQWRLMTRMEPPFEPVRDPWQLVGVRW